MKDLVIHHKVDEIINYNAFFPKEYNQGLVYAAYYGYLDLIEIICNLKKNIVLDWSSAMSYAILGNNLDIINFIRSKQCFGFNNERDMSFAIYSRNMDIVRSISTDKNYILKAAAYAGRMDIIEKNRQINWNQIILYAVTGGNLNIVKYIISKNRRANHRIDWNKLICEAAYHGHLEILQFIMHRCPNNWNKAFICAVKGGHVDTVSFLMSRLQNFTDWNLVLQFAAFYDHYEIVKLIMNKQKKFNWAMAITCAAKSGNMDIVELISFKENEWSSLDFCNWELVLSNAAASGNIELFNYLFNKRKVSDNWTERVFKSALSYGNFEIAALILHL